MAECLACLREEARRKDEEGLEGTLLGRFHSSHLGNLPYALDPNYVVERRLRDLLSAMEGPGGSKVPGLAPEWLYHEYRKAETALDGFGGGGATRHGMARLLPRREGWRMQPDERGGWNVSDGGTSEGDIDANCDPSTARLAHGNLSSPDRREVAKLLSTSPDSTPGRDDAILPALPTLPSSFQTGVRGCRKQGRAVRGVVRRSATSVSICPSSGPRYRSSPFSPQRTLNEQRGYVANGVRALEVVQRDSPGPKASPRVWDTPNEQPIPQGRAAMKAHSDLFLRGEASDSRMKVADSCLDRQISPERPLRVAPTEKVALDALADLQARFSHLQPR